MTLTSAEARTRGRIGGLAAQLRPEARAQLAAARAAITAKYARLVDPDGTLAPAERDRLAALARRKDQHQQLYRARQARGTRRPRR